MKKCMFGCLPDDLELPKHWETKCKGNPEVKKCNSNFHDPHIRKQYTKVEKCSVCGEV